MDDDDFSDDGFDGLNDSVLQELEAKAIQSTQARLASTQQPSQAAAPRQPSHRQQPQRPGPHQPQQQRQTPPQPPQLRRQAQQEHDSYDYGLDDDDLDDTEVFEQISQQPRGSVAVATATSRPIQAARLPANIAGHRSAFVRPQQQQSQFAPRSVPQQSQFVPRPPPQLSQFVRHPPPRPSQLAPQLLPIRATYGVNPPQGAPAPAAGNSKQDDNSAAIQAKLSETEAKLMSAQGEIAILRSKLDKAQRDRQEEIDRVKKQAAEHAAKQERLIEEERAAHRTADTELQFARQNLREGLGRARNKKHDAGATTPKKAKKWGQADGFDNLEVMSVSPGKGHAGLRRNNSGPGAQSTTERTPTKGKRKRPAVDSPSFALEIQETDTGIITGKAVDPMYLQIRPANDLPYDFLRLVLEHSAHLGQPPTFDLFSRYAFPSDPGQTFAAIAFQKLSRLGDAKEPLRLLVDFAQMILDMWQRCLTERYHAPIYYLASLVRYTLDLNAMAVAPRVISSLIPVCTSTCRLVAEPRFHSVGGNLSSHPNSGVRQLCLDVDVTQCLEILHLAALGCVVQSAPSLGGNSVVDWVQPQCSPQEQFWRTIEPDFVLMMLDKKHPERDWLAIIGLLWSSVLPGSIGPIPTKVSMAAVPMAPPNRGNANANAKRTEAEDSADAAMGVIRRVAYFLTDMPSWAPRGTIKELKVRSNALRTLMIFASSPFGAMQIAKNDAAIPRLVTAWSWAIDRLYDVDGGLPRMKTTPRPKGSKATARKKAAVADAGDAMDVDRAPQDEPPQDENLESDWSEEDEQVDEIDDGAQLFAQLPKFISEATRLLHMLITHPRTANVVDIADKLATYPGATQRYFLTLARLSLQEDDLIIDASIPFETADLAGEMLRMVVNMEDAEAFHEAFPDSVQH